MSNETNIIHEIHKTVKRIAVKSEPKTDFDDIFAEKSHAKLKSIAKKHKIPKYTTMDKPALIQALKEKLTDEITLKAIILVAKVDDMTEFENVIYDKKVTYDSIIVSIYFEFFIDLGLVEIYLTKEDEFLAVIPTEIKKAILLAYSGEYKERIKREHLIKNYATACANLYGCITQQEFVDIYNLQNNDNLLVADAFNLLIYTSLDEEEFYFYEDYLVAPEFKEEEFADIANFVLQVEDKPRYIPNKDELLNYVLQEYFEETIYTKKVKDFITSICDDVDLADYVADELCFMCTCEADVNDILNFLEEEEIVFENSQELEKFANILVELKNNSRIWNNKAYTPTELFNISKNPNSQLKQKKQTPITTNKIGRNEPCPCNSGKKYKKCCGR